MESSGYLEPDVISPWNDVFYEDEITLEVAKRLGKDPRELQCLVPVLAQEPTRTLYDNEDEEYDEEE